MINKEANVLLVVGCQRSGTTLLASMLGRHSEINMLFESQGNDVLKLIGKKYSGNKLLAWRQIRINQKASYFGHFMNRVQNFDFKKKNKHHKVRPYPTSHLSITDYLSYNTKPVVIFRKKEDTIASIVKRTKMSVEQAEHEWEKSDEILQFLTQNGAHSIQFSELVTKPKEIMEGVCHFLHIPYEETMLDGSKYNYVYPSKTIQKNKANT